VWGDHAALAVSGVAPSSCGSQRATATTLLGAAGEAPSVRHAVTRAANSSDANSRFTTRTSESRCEPDVNGHTLESQAGRRVEGVSASHGQDVSMTDPVYELRPIAWVESALVDLGAAPKQGDEGAPEADPVFNPDVADGIKDLRVGDEIVLLTWLDRARRDILVLHPRGDERNPRRGVFSTRSPDRPNPVGLHRVEIVSIDGSRVRVRHLEALDGTPVIDVKPILEPIGDR